MGDWQGGCQQPDAPRGDPVKLVSQSVGRACAVSYGEFYRGWNEPRGSRQGWPPSTRATQLVSQLPCDYIIGVHTSYLKEASGALNATRFLPPRPGEIAEPLSSRTLTDNVCAKIIRLAQSTGGLEALLRKRSLRPICPFRLAFGAEARLNTTPVLQPR